MPDCRDCGGRHSTGYDGLACDWRMGGEPRVRARLAAFGIPPATVDRIVADLAQENDHA